MLEKKITLTNQSEQAVGLVSLVYATGKMGRNEIEGYSSFNTFTKEDLEGVSENKLSSEGP